MSEYNAKIHWKRSSDDFTLKTYNRDHQWQFTEALSFPASAAPEYAGDPAMVNPEQGFVAALASCHMLTFLAIAAQKGYVIDSYRDDAVGVLAKNDQGKTAITEVMLAPQVQFAGDKLPSADELQKLHDAAHQHCFIANSVTARVHVK